MTSTRDLTLFPSPNILKRRLQALAMLDAILEEEWQYRYYSFNAKWSADTQMGSMRNGGGDDFYAWFGVAGCFLRGFDHESPMSPWAGEGQKVWPGVLDSVPAAFDEALNEPAFHMQDTTFCIWRSHSDQAWTAGAIEFPADSDDPDGSVWMLTPLDGDPATYQEFAEEYYERDVAMQAVAHVFEHAPISQALLTLLGSQRTLEDVLKDAEEIGYPAG